MAIDIEQLVKSRFRPAAQASGSRYFLMKVDKVVQSPKDPDTFRAIGERLDTGEVAYVTTRKSSSGQKLPVQGEVMRADKATQVQVANRPEINAFRAEYFYSYGDDSGLKSFCLEATAMPSIPRLNEENGMWSAQVMAVDSEAATDITADSFVTGEIDAEIAKLLRPWEGDVKPNAVTHDVLGRSLWGEGKEALQGVSPFVTVRFAGESVRVFGAGAVRSEESTDQQRVYRLPTQAETMASIANNRLLNSLKAAFKDLPVEALKEHGVAVIPGVALQVGRESLSGSSQKYLKVPQQFQWADEKRTDEQGQPVVRAGYRDANIHIKASRSGRMIVVDTVPASNGTFSRGVPLTPSELARQEGVQQQSQTQQQQQQPAPAQQQAAPAQQQQAAAPAQQQPAPAQQQPVVQPEPAPALEDDFNDYSEYAQDLDDITRVSGDFFDELDEGMPAPEPELADDYLEQQMAAARSRGPRM